MTAMNASLESALLASLQNPSHAWEVTSVVENTSDANVLIGEPARKHVTFQVQSEVLESILVVMVHKEDGVVQETDVFFSGSAFRTTSGDLHTQLSSMASSVTSNQQAAFEAMLRRVFSDGGAMTASSSLTATAGVTV